MDGVILGLALSYMHFLIIIFKIFQKSKIDFSLLKSRLGFVSNNYWTNISGIAKNHLDKIIVLPLIGFELLGNYALALQMYAVFMMFSKIVYVYTLPHDSVGEPLTKIKLISIAVSIVITILGISIAPYIIPLIFPKYVEAIFAIQIISLAIIPSTIALILSSKILGNEKSKIILTGRIIFAGVFIGTVVLLTPFYGIIGITTGFVIASITQCIVLFVYSKLK